jgi:transcription-repair coupling factor (superfamily II helicase)
VAGAAEARFEAVTDYYENRMRAAGAEPGSYRPLAADALYLTADEFAERTAAAHALTPFHEPDSSGVVDFAVDAPRVP